MRNIKDIVCLGESLGNVLAGRENRREKMRVKHWKNKNPNASEIIRQITTFENLNRQTTFYDKVDSSAAWNRLSARLGQYTLPRPRVRRIPLTQRLLQYAAIGLVILATGAGYYLWHTGIEKQEQVSQLISEILPGGKKAILLLADKQAIELNDSIQFNLKDSSQIHVNQNTIAYENSTRRTAEEYNTLITPRGGEFRLVLADGTQVWLNADSRLKYFVHGTEKERLVFLEGEAYFKVAPNKHKPFVVISGDQRIRVLGTEFNISAYQNESTIYTTLVGGCVSVEIQGKKPLVQQLNQYGQQARFNRLGTPSLAVCQVDPEIYTSWKTGTFRFHYATLDEILEKLARWYDFNYKIECMSCHLSHFSGEFNRYENLNTVLEIIRSTGIPISLDYKDGKLIIK